jgi:hypothetical protein
MKRLPAAAILSVALAASAAAQQPSLENARLLPQAVTGTLASTVRQIVNASTEPTWIAYAVPILEGNRVMCCFSGDSFISGRVEGVACCGGCRLEPGTGSSVFSRGDRSGTRLEDPDTFFIFYRVENRRIERVRMFSEACALDAGGRTVHWLTGVKPAESIALLHSLAAAEDATSRTMKGALSALAQHADPAAVTPLIRLARDGSDSRIRGEALFWLAQRAGDRATAAIKEAIESDPETDVKKKAVFALSQLPKDEGVPLLIDVARKNRNPAVRKQAMFWLGQSKDPRAIAFFEEILK